MCSQSAAFDTSAGTYVAWPPRSAIMRTVSRPASSLRSAATMRAPSVAKSRADSLPMPLAAPVISATLSRRRIRFPPSDPLEVAQSLPVGDRRVEGLELFPEEVRVVLDD